MNEQLRTTAQPGGLLGYFRQHPRGFWFIFWGELAERCSFYGMRVLLVVYMTTELLFSDSRASDINYYFKASCYLMPLLGGFIADRFLGKYWTIVIFSFPYVLGQFLVGQQWSLFGHENGVFFLALGLLAFGTGVIKPNISTLMGMTYDQQRPGNEQLRTDAFYMFYFAINVGAALSMATLPFIATRYGYRVAFLVPAVLMILALIAFAAGKPYYAVEKIERRAISPEERADRWRVLRRLLGVFGMISLWWFVYDQNDTQWVFFARDNLNLQVTDTWRVEPNAIQSINGFLILALVPLTNLFFKAIDPTGRRFPSTTKIMIGFLLMAGAQGLLAFAGLLSSGGARVSVWWMVAAYVVLTASEVLVSTIGLELAFTAAPQSMKSFVTALFLLTVFIGNIIASQTASGLWRWLGPTAFFTAMAALMLALAILFVPIARAFTRSRSESPAGAT
jgi:POT family proton-dependent oligopeptide transporter